MPAWEMSSFVPYLVCFSFQVHCGQFAQPFLASRGFQLPRTGGRRKAKVEFRNVKGPGVICNDVLDRSSMPSAVARL